GGILTKMSFTLFLAALALDHVWRAYDAGKFKSELKRIIILFGSMAILAAGIYYVYGLSHPYFVQYAEHFKIFNFGARGYFDLSLRLFKFVIWLSPLLALPAIY